MRLSEYSKLIHKPDVILVSGGLDSYSLVKFYDRMYSLSKNPELILLQVLLGQPYEKKEEKVCRELYGDFPNFKVIKMENYLTNFDISEDNYIIPGRNLMLATVAASFGEVIWIGGVAEENHSYMLDKNTKAFELMSETLCTIFGSKKIIESPFFNLDRTKVDNLVFLAVSKDENYLKTTSCYHPTKKACGECVVCARRNLAENLAEHILKEHTKVIAFNRTKFSNPNFSKHYKDMVFNYLNAFRKKDYSHYDKDRIIKDLLSLSLLHLNKGEK